jgi:hypothetical protein
MSAFRGLVSVSIHWSITESVCIDVSALTLVFGAVLSCLVVSDKVVVMVKYGGETREKKRKTNRNPIGMICTQLELDMIYKYNKQC